MDFRSEHSSSTRGIGIRSLAVALARALLITMLILKPANRIVRYFGYAILATSVFLQVIDAPNFPFLAMLTTGATVVVIAFLYDVVCAFLEALVREER